MNNSIYSNVRIKRESAVTYQYIQIEFYEFIFIDIIWRHKRKVHRTFNCSFQLYNNIAIRLKSFYFSLL